MLSIQSFIPDDARGKLDGLMGHYDGDRMNDFRNRTGDIVCPDPDNCTLSVIHYEFGETCM